MKICHYNEGLAGAVVGEKLYPIGDVLMKAGHLKPGHTMLEAIGILANEPAAMKLARFAVQTGSSVSLASVKLLAPILNPVCTANRSEEHTSELQSLTNLVCRLLLEKKK